MYIQGINENGLLSIGFHQEMEMISDLTSVDNTVIEFSIETQDREYAYKRVFDWEVASYNTTNCTI